MHNCSRKPGSSEQSGEGAPRGAELSLPRYLLPSTYKSVELFMYSFIFLRQGLMSPRPAPPFYKAEGDLGLLIPKSCDSGGCCLNCPFYPLLLATFAAGSVCRADKEDIVWWAVELIAQLVYPCQTGPLWRRLQPTAHAAGSVMTWASELLHRHAL